VPYRLVGRADDRVDEIFQISEVDWGLEGARRYGRLILVAMNSIGDFPAIPGSRPIPRVRGARAFHLRSARDLVDREHQVKEPRHLIVYRVAPDGVVKVLDLVHDPMLLGRAARHALRAADR
jgi:plasmid stabilization system protein ParE